MGFLLPTLLQGQEPCAQHLPPPPRGGRQARLYSVVVRAADPDPSDPYVFGPPGSEPDPLVRGIDPDSYPAPDPSIIKQTSKKNLDSYCFYL